MLDESIQKEILRSIALTGAATEENAISIPIIGDSKSNGIINRSSGRPAIHSRIAKKFSLIIGQPKEIAALSNLEIRCCVCRKIISYPCWYYRLEFAVKVFHYFVCYSADSPEKVNARCYKR